MGNTITKETTKEFFCGKEEKHPECPVIVPDKCPSENIKTEKGVSYGGATYGVAVRYHTNNIYECATLAKWNKGNGVVQYTYRDETHPEEQWRNTCTLKTDIKSPVVLKKQKNSIYSGCVDSTKTLKNKCI